MRNKMKNYLGALVWVLLLSHNTAMANEVAADILVKGSTSWDGGAIAYPQGKAELIVQKITITPGGKKEISLAMHCHTIPLAAYVTKGSLKVVKASGEEKVFKAGDAFIEVMKTWHKGVFNEDAELIVFYAGEKDVPVSTKKDGNADLIKLCN
jgi:quercetin dioxygenase-like cupin family protein